MKGVPVWNTKNQKEPQIYYQGRLIFGKRLKKLRVKSLTNLVTAVSGHRCLKITMSFHEMLVILRTSLKRKCMISMIRVTGTLPCVQRELLVLFGHTLKISCMVLNILSHIRFTTWDQCFAMNVHNQDANGNFTKLVLKH